MIKQTIRLLALSALLHLALPATASPNFISAGAMSSPRSEHTATLLPNGKVLFAAGTFYSYTESLASADLFNPTNGLWRNTGSLNLSRLRHTATLLPSGKVLIAGGDGDGYPMIPDLSSAELYDFTTETWTNTGSLHIGRELHTMTMLANGKVLVVGGAGTNVPHSLSSAELYDPTTGTWTATGSLNAPRYLHTTTLLPNGKVLVVGGLNDYFNGPGGQGLPLSSAELYDPATGQWTYTYPMSTNRFGHTATLLPTGKVLVVGGSDWINACSSAELYDPATELWTPTGSLNTTREWHTATSLPNGKVLVAGGEYSDTNFNTIMLSNAELYDPTNGTWMQVGTMTDARGYGLTATLIPSGKVLFAGGLGTNGTLASAELFDPTIAVVTLGNLSQIYDGTAKGVSVTTMPPGLSVNLIYNGFSNAPTNAGSYTVIGTVNDAYYVGSATNTFTINNKVVATVTLDNLNQLYDGTAKSVSVTTDPLGLTVDLIYNGSANAPTNVGSYTVAGIINDAQYAGGATNTLVIHDIADYFTYTTNDLAITITGYTGAGGDVVIPATINGMPVTSIGDNAFVNNFSLTSVYIPSNVANIGNNAFANCNSLMAINVNAANASYSSIDGVVFNKNQTTIIQFPNGRGGSYVIPGSVTNIGNNAFYASLKLTSITIPNGVISIGSYSFDACWSLTSITIPNSVTSIGDDAFNSCINLASVIISTSVASIGDGAFAGCNKLTNITIPASVNSIGAFAFWNCTSLTALYFSGNAPNVGFGVFASDNNATVYYLTETTGWDTTLGGRPTALWPAPALGISTYNNQPTVFFPTATGTNFTLQMTTNLVSGNWVTVSNGIPVSGIIITNPSGSAFFRLH